MLDRNGDVPALLCEASNGGGDDGINEGTLDPMDTQTAHRVQAYVDGELPEQERSEVEAVLAADSDAKELLEALEEGRKWLRTNELGRVVPEPRDFYWAQVVRGIEQAQAAEAEAQQLESEPLHREGRLIAGWVRWLLPVGGLAALMMAFVFSEYVPSGGPVGGIEKAASYHEVDHTVENGGLITFRSDSEGVTVVWITSE